MVSISLNLPTCFFAKYSFFLILFPDCYISTDCSKICLVIYDIMEENFWVQKCSGVRILTILFIINWYWYISNYQGANSYTEHKQIYLAPNSEIRFYQYLSDGIMPLIQWWRSKIMVGQNNVEVKGCFKQTCAPKESYEKEESEYID